MSKCNVSVVCCCLILAGGPALTGATEPAEETPGDVTYSTSPAAGGWNAGTRAQPSRQSQSPVEPGPAEMTLRLYDGARDFGPVYGNKGEVMALDVTSELETCADGNTIVRALHIGSWRYQLDAACDDFSSGTRITVEQGPSGTVIRQQVNPKREAGGPTVIRCDSSTWTCRSEPR